MTTLVFLEEGSDTPLQTVLSDVVPPEGARIELDVGPRRVLRVVYRFRTDKAPDVHITVHTRW